MNNNPFSQNIVWQAIKWTLIGGTIIVTIIGIYKLLNSI